MPGRVCFVNSSPAELLSSLSGLLLLLSAGCSRPPAKTETAGAEPSQIKVEVKPGGPDRPDHQFGRVPDSALGIHTGIAAQGRSEAHAGRSQAPVAATFWCRTASRFSLLWTSARPRFRTARANWAAASEWKFLRARPTVRLRHSANCCRSKSMTTFPICCSRARNTRTPAPQDFHIDRVIEQQHRFSASLADKKAQPYDMWSFHGASYDWGKDES